MINRLTFSTRKRLLCFRDITECLRSRKEFLTETNLFYYSIYFAHGLHHLTSKPCWNHLLDRLLKANIYSQLSNREFLWQDIWRRFISITFQFYAPPLCLKFSNNTCGALWIYFIDSLCSEKPKIFHATSRNLSNLRILNRPKAYFQ